jgi:hypothetical protein
MLVAQRLIASKKVYQQSILNYGCVAAGKEVDCGADTASQ